MHSGAKLHGYSCYSRSAGSSRVRLYDWFDHLGISSCDHPYSNASSISIRQLVCNPCEAFLAERSLRKHAGGVAMISREASPFSSGRLESQIFSRSDRGIFDIDDALFNDIRLRRKVFGGAAKFEIAAAAANVVIVGNPYLAEWAHRHSENVVVIPSCVEPKSYSIATHSEESGPVIVWLGSPSTETYLASIATTLNRVHEETGARLRIVSGPNSNPALRSIGHMIERVPWHEDTYQQHLADATVGISPLMNTPFAQGKCAYKILQYAAAGLPIIGDPVGANDQALRILGGIPAHGPGEWMEALVSVIRMSRDQLLSAGATARTEVSLHYSFAAWENEWKSAVFG